MPKKVGFLNRIGNTKVGSIFISTEDEGLDTSEQPVVVPASAQTTLTSTVSFRPVPNIINTNSNVDPEIKAKIEQIAKSADQVSYTKFSELLASMRATFPGDENAAFRASLAAAKTAGYPVGEILRGLDVILGQLNKAKDQFKAAVPVRITAKVGSRRQKIAELQQAAENNRQSIASVQAELTRLKANEAEIGKNIQVETSAISQDEQIIREDETRFLNTMQAVESEYLAERQKLESYGKGT